MTEPDHQQLSESTVEPGKRTGGALQPWDVGDLPSPPEMNWKKLPTLIGPGILMAGVAIGAGEWLFGPAVSAQYGGTLLWLATLCPRQATIIQTLLLSSICCAIFSL